MTLDSEVAKLVLDMITQVSVKADDQSLNNVLFARQWLGRIARGEATVCPIRALDEVPK